MIDTIDSLPANGFTPLSETLYEAGQYFAGRSVVFGDQGSPVSVANSRTGNTLSSRTLSVSRLSSSPARKTTWYF